MVVLPHVLSSRALAFGLRLWYILFLVTSPLSFHLLICFSRASTPLASSTPRLRQPEPPCRRSSARSLGRHLCPLSPAAPSLKTPPLPSSTTASVLAFSRLLLSPLHLSTTTSALVSSRRLLSPSFPSSDPSVRILGSLQNVL